MLPGKQQLDGRVCRNNEGALLFRPYDPIDPPPPLNDPVTFYCEGVNNAGGKPQAMQASITALEPEGLAIALELATALSDRVRGVCPQPPPEGLELAGALLHALHEGEEALLA